MPSSSHLFKAVCVTVVAVCIAVGYFLADSSELKVEEVQSVSSSNPKSSERTRQVLIATEENEPAARPKHHKTIKRQYAHMDRLIIGEEPRLDSRGSKRVFENRVLQVVSKEKGLAARERVSVLRNLSTLSEEEQASLYEAIYNDELPEGVSRSSWNWVVDVMMTTLRTQGAETAEMVEQFSRTYENKSADLTVRDYALQHLGHIKGEGGNIEVIDSVLHTARSEKEGTLAGTALLAIDNTIDLEALPPEEREQRAINAYNVARDPRFSLESRVTALQVAARHKPELVVDLAQSILDDESSPEILQLSAQAALNKKNQNE